MLITGNDCQLTSDFEEREAELSRRCKRHADTENHDTVWRDAADPEYDSQDYDKSDDIDMYELLKDGKSLSCQIKMEVSMYQHFRWNTELTHLGYITMQRPCWSNNMARKDVDKSSKETNEPNEMPLTRSTQDNAKRGTQAIRPSGSSETEKSAGSPISKGKQKVRRPNSVSN